MVIGAEIHQATAWSQKAFERLIKEGLPPTPNNYALFYQYYSGEDPSLNVALDEVASRGKLTQKKCDDLGDKHLPSSSEKSFFKTASGIIDTELQKVLELITATNKENNQYGENLDDFSGKLERSVSIESLREAVKKISEETTLITEQNDKLQKELAYTTSQLSEIRNDFNRVHREAQVDTLTQVGNRKFFDHEILRTTSEAYDQNSMLSLLMVDIDYFKKFNDAHGHLVGDQVLRLVARTLVENLKGRDVIARYGGEEFVIMLPQTRLVDAERVANQLRNSLSSKQVKKRDSNALLGTVTISIGASEYVRGEDSNALIARADEALYKAKQTGRNKVVCVAPENNGQA